jgi:hypothetical protein
VLAQGAADVLALVVDGGVEAELVDEPAAFLLARITSPTSTGSM